MVIDTSALLVLLGNEAEAERFREALAADSVRLVSAATVLEATLVVESRWGDAGGRELDHLLVKADVEVVPVDLDQLTTAGTGGAATEGVAMRQP